MSSELPIDAVLPDLLTAVADHPVVILQAEPGAGKTTRVPLALLKTDIIAPGKKILMLEPRRVAARAAAAFMAQLLGERVGETVGYRVRFESQVGPRTRLEILTQGMLTRRIQDDPELSDVGLIIFDEFHERQLASDLGLALALDTAEGLRDDLKILVMSATLELTQLSSFLDDAPVITSQGRGFPVTVEHLPSLRADEQLEHQVTRSIHLALDRHDGDILVFLPGLRSIRRVQSLLRDAAADVFALHGEMHLDEQAELLRVDETARRRVILATNVAESSITLPRVTVVIDTGLANEPRFDPQTGLSSLRTVRISQASATQRTGRAGRLAPGHAYRLWPTSQRLDAQRRPEITQRELSGLVLEMAAWGSDQLRFLDPPPAGTLAAARDELKALDFLDPSGRITAAGRQALAMGTDPRLARMILESDDPEATAALLALLESRSADRGDDLQRRYRRFMAQPNAREFGPARQLKSQWQRRLVSKNRNVSHKTDNRDSDVGLTLAHGYLNWVARRSDKDPLRFHLFNGLTATLHPETELRGHEWLVVADMAHGKPHASIRAAAPMSENGLRQHFANHWVTETVAEFDPATESMHAYQVETFGRIETARKSAGTPDKAEAAKALLQYVRQQGLQALPFNDSWLHRARCAMHWLPDQTADWPRLDSDALLADAEQWLLPLLGTRLKHLDPQAVGQAIRNRLTWAQQQQVDAWCPTSITVPSGMDRPVAYQFEEHWRNAEGHTVPHAHPPVLAVKLQELFGLENTPRIANGTIALTLHLLSPGGKPLQVTQDLHSFWHNTYPEVRKEMKGRYPKHPWPDDPWSAVPTHRAKPRKS